MHFGQMQTVYEVYLKSPGSWPEGTPKSLANFYAEKTAEALQKYGKIAQSYLELKMEDAWFRLGCPQYKIYPNIVEALARTKIEIPASEFKMPFDVIMVRLPVGVLREHAEAPSVTAVMLTIGTLPAQTATDQRQGPPVTEIFMRTDFDTPTLEDRGMLTVFQLYSDTSISESFDRMPPREPDSKGYWPSLTFTKKLLSIAISTCFIAIAKEREVQGHPEVRLLVEEAPNTAEKLKLDKLRKRGGQSTFKGYAVGRDIVLPKIDSRAKYENEGGGEPLRFGHIRSAHMRRQHFGPGNRDLKVIFIYPTWVRPDLPAKPKLTERAITGLPEANEEPNPLMA